MEMSGFFRPGRGEDVHDFLRGDGARDDLPNGGVQLLVGLGSPAAF